MEFWDRHKMITYYYDALTRSLCERHGLTRMEYEVLLFLVENPTVKTAAEIVRLRRATKSHVSLALAALEEKRLIERRTCPENKKRIEIFLSEDGVLIAREGTALREKLKTELFAGLTDEERAIYRCIFEKICKNAEAHLAAENGREV